MAKYRPYYEEWVRLLRLVNEKIYVLQHPVQVARIYAQYEVKNCYRPKCFTSYFKRVNFPNHYNRGDAEWRRRRGRR